MDYPKPLQELIDSLQFLPGIGAKTAERLALFILDDLRDDRASKLSQSILMVKRHISTCKVCGNFCEGDMCEVCLDSSRDVTKLCVVQSPKDIYFFERIGVFKGRYHVLNGLISPVDGVGPDDIALPELIERLKDDQISEIVLALSATTEGEMTSKYISQVLDQVPIVISRLAHGIPVGGDIGYADEMTLLKAFMNRQEIDK